MHATNLRSLKSAGGFFPSAPLALLVPSVLRAVVSPSECPLQVILPTASGVSNEGRSSPLLVPLPPFLGPGFRLGARWNRLVEAVKTRKKREKTGKKWARYGLKRVNTGRDRRDQLEAEVALFLELLGARPGLSVALLPGNHDVGIFAEVPGSGREVPPIPPNVTVLSEAEGTIKQIQLASGQRVSVW